jgi:Domain of unknown function (DUF4386)
MIDYRTAGRWFALSLLGVYAIQLSSNFLLQPSLRQGGGDAALALMTGAAAQPALVGAIAMLGLLSGCIELGGASLLGRVLLGQRGHTLALLYLGMCAAGVAASLAEHGMQLALRDVGRSLRDSPGADSLVLQGLLAALRNGLHFPRMLLGGTSVLVFFALALRADLLPRALAVLGLAAAASQMVGVSMAVLGGEVALPLLAPLLLMHLAAALWLLARGFGSGPRPALPST